MTSPYVNTRERSVYALGANDGFWVGLAMGVCTMCMILSARYAMAAFVGMALFLCTPYLVWRFLRRAWIEGYVPPTFSAVWLHGICIFLFGSIIMAFIMYCTLRFIEPGWIERETALAVERLLADPQTAQQGRILQKVLESGEMPSPIYTSVSSIWLVSFTGSLWSMIFSFILTKTKHFIRLREKNLAKQ